MKIKKIKRKELIGVKQDASILNQDLVIKLKKYFEKLNK